MQKFYRPICFAFALFSGLASPSLAEQTNGTIIVMGKGIAASPPEKVSYAVTITSICYNTSQEAAAANAALAQDVLTVLEKFKTGDRDRVTATGGAVTRQTETAYIGSNPHILCELKWRAENNLRIEMAKFSDLSILQDSLMVAIKNSGGLDANAATQTYAEVGKPEFGLYPETIQALRDKAQALAFADARTQMKAFLAQCAFVDPRLISITPAEFHSIYRLAGIRMPADSYSAPVIPDALEVSSELRMEWAFTPSSACRN